MVLIHYDPNLPFSRFIPDPAERKWFFDNVCTHEWNLEQDRGRSWEEAEAALIAEYPAHEQNIRNFRRHWHEMVPHEIAGSVALMRGLIAKGYDVTLLTNFAADTLVEARQRFPFLNETRGVTISAEIRLIKPDPAIYAHHTRTFGLDPARTLFTDDNAANIAAAREFGWQAIHFTGPAALEKALAGHGIAL